MTSFLADSTGMPYTVDMITLAAILSPDLVNQCNYDGGTTRPTISGPCGSPPANPIVPVTARKPHLVGPPNTSKQLLCAKPGDLACGISSICRYIGS